MGFIYCNLRVLMAERGLNIQKVKDQTTLSRTTISNLYNNNGSGVQFDTMLQLCEILRCSPGDLFSYIDLRTKFEVTNEDFKMETEVDLHSIDEEGNGYEYTSKIRVELKIKCSLIYQGKHTNLDIFSLVELGINEEKKLDSMSYTTNESIDEKISFDILNWLPSIDYFEESLTNFIIDWAFEEFYDEYIDEIGNMHVNHALLQDAEE